MTLQRVFIDQIFDLEKTDKALEGMTACGEALGSHEAQRRPWNASLGNANGVELQSPGSRYSAPWARPVIVASVLKTEACRRA